MAVVGKAKLDHPPLNTTGGASLYNSIEAIYTKISDYLPSRWFAYTAVAGQTYTEIEHNLQVPFADVRVTVYTVSGSVTTKVTSVTNSAGLQVGSSTLWLVAAVSGYEQTKVAIKPPTGGPYTFYVFINHCPVDDKLPLSGGTLTGALTLSADPTSDLQAATKSYVDTVAQGLDPKGSVRAATTAGITLSGLQTVDGVSLSAGDRVLVKNQGFQFDNGIYLVASGAWTRALDFNAWTEIPSAFVFVEQGTALKDSGWVCTSDQFGTLGSSSITWVQFSGAGVLAGDNSTITVSSNTISAKLDATSATLASSASGLKVADLGIKDAHVSYSAAIAGSKISPYFNTTLQAPTIYADTLIQAPTLTASSNLNLGWSSEPTAPSDGARIYCPDNTNLFFKSGAEATAKQLLTGTFDTDTLSVTDTAPLPGLRNRIINGSFSVDQRFNFGGTTLVSGTKKLVCDRWWAKATGSTPTVTATRGSIRLRGAPSLTALQLGTYIESLNTWDLVNKTVTLSFDVIATGNGGVDLDVYTPTAADNYATTTSLFSASVTTANTTSQRVSVTFDAAACLYGIGFTIGLNTSNFQTTGTYYDISNVQLEVGGKATAMEVRPYAVELDLCQRYYVAISDIMAQGITQATDTNIDIYAMLPKPMRTTSVTAAWAAFTNGVTGNTTQRNLGAKALSGANCYGNQMWASGTLGTGITALKPCLVRLNALVVDAEITLV